MSELSFNGKRMVLIVGLVQFGFCLANYYFRLGFLGRYDREVFLASIVVLAILTHYFGPTIAEMQAYQAKRKGAKQE